MAPLGTAADASNDEAELVGDDVDDEVLLHVSSSLELAQTPSSDAAAGGSGSGPAGGEDGAPPSF